MDALVTQSDDVAWGAAVISGTRVPVDTLFEYLETGKSLDDFLEGVVAASEDIGRLLRRQVHI